MSHYGPLRVENWDNLTLMWLKSADGASTAALIKAAPDLLAACKMAATHIEPGSAGQPVLDHLRAVIAKAEGATQKR